MSGVEDTVGLRNAIVTRLDQNTALTALWGGRFYGEAQPPETAWPFGRYGVPILTPDEASGWNGARHRVTLHVFARGPSMDECAALCALVAEELDQQDIPLETVGDREADAYEVFLAGAQIIRDGTNDWHGILEFDVAVAGA